MQMQMIANMHPDDDIEYVFYDDRLEYLASLAAFFEENASLIPKNVSLKLCQYLHNLEDDIDPEKDLAMDESRDYELSYTYPRKDVATIQGMGFINSRYKDTVREMIGRAKLDGNTPIDMITSQYLSPSTLNTPKALRAQAPLPSVTAKGLFMPKKAVLQASPETILASNKDCVRNFMLKMIADYQIGVKKEFPGLCMYLPNPFVIGKGVTNNCPYIEAGELSCMMTQDSTLLFSKRNPDKNSDTKWIPLQDEQLVTLFSTHELFRAILNNKKPDSQLLNQSFNLSSDEQQILSLVQDFFDEKSKAYFGASNTVCNYPKSDRIPVPFKVGKTYGTGEFYICDKDFSIRLENGKLTFSMSMSGDKKNWVIIRPEQAFNESKLVRGIVAHQKSVNTPEESGMFAKINSWFSGL